MCEAGFQQADVVVERTYTTQTALHNCLEPHGCTAVWEGEQLTLWSSTQSIFDGPRGGGREAATCRHTVSG